MNEFIKLLVTITGYLTTNAYVNVDLSEYFFFDVEHSLNMNLTDELRNIVWRLHKTEYITVALIDSTNKIIEEWRLVFCPDSKDEKKQWRLAKATGGKFSFDGLPYVRVADLLKVIRRLQDNAMQMYIKALIKKSTSRVEKPKNDHELVENGKGEGKPKPEAKKK
jgi:hypothetical protein